MSEPLRLVKKDVWLKEEYWTEDGQPDTRTQRFASKQELIKKMKAKNGFPTICLYELQKNNEFTGKIYGQIRTLTILFQEPEACE